MVAFRNRCLVVWFLGLTMALAPQGALASPEEDARVTFWWTSLIAAATSSVVVLTSIGLATSSNVAFNRLGQVVPSSPQNATNLLALKSEVARNVIWEYVGTAFSAFELAIVGSLFAANHYKQPKTTAVLSMIYFAPALLNVIGVGVGADGVRRTCQNDTRCWDDHARDTFMSWLTAWGVFRGLSFVAPMIGLGGTRRLVSQHDYFK